MTWLGRGCEPQPGGSGPSVALPEELVEPDRNIAEVLDQAFNLINVAVYGALAVVGVISWIRRRDAASAWFAAMFSIIASAVGVGILVVGDNPYSLAILSLFPLALYRFTRAFSHGHRAVDVGTALLTAIVLVWSFRVDLPDGVPSGEGLAFVVTFLLHWVLVSGVAAWYFSRQARRTRGVASRRLRFFAIATMMLAVALLILLLTGDAAIVPTIVAEALAISAAAMFLFALAPPRWLRTSWRARELETMQGGLRHLLEGETVGDVRSRTLAAAQRLTGGAGAVLLDEDHEPVASRGVDDPAAALAAARAGDPRMLHVDRLVVVGGRTTPWFGADERQLLDTISGFATVAEERASVLQREREANEKLRQVDQLKTEFVAMVAHDLRSPMTVVTGFADTIHDRWDELPDEKKLEYLRLISRNTRSLAEFVEDVLQVARMESGDMSYHVEPFDPREVVERIVRDMRHAHPDVRLIADMPSVVPEALGDAERNWQILTNLVGNAVKFCDAEPEIRVHVKRVPGVSEVAIAVTDNGVGIDPEDVPRLFRRFSRVGSTRRTVAGTGLGLYIVKSMVEAQGGRIWVESEPGRGSTFTYTLPIAGGGVA